jgi:rubrerythrin
MKKGVKELSDAYLESAAEFSAMLKERTPREIAYDSEVVVGLRRGLSILRALELAKEKYPDEAIQWDDDSIVDIKDHYEYLMNHEDILSKLKGLSSKK